MTQSEWKRGAHLIHGPTGRIELRIDLPEAKAAWGEVAVVCHPHPQFGGTLDNKVAYTLARAYNELGMPAVRFNFRGVGESEGEYDQGVGEVDDCLAVVHWVRRQYGDVTVHLAGFSFGAIVALRAVVRCTGIASLVTVAPPIAYFENDAFSAPKLPWVVIQGGSDELVPSHEVLRWAQSLKRPPRVELFPQTSHFFHGQLPELRHRVVSSVRDAVTGSLE